MHPPRLPVLVLLLTSISLCTNCSPGAAAAREGEDSALEPTSVTVFGERLLLFMEHPHLVQGAPARFLAHLTVLETGEPVRSGAVTLEIGATRLAIDGPKRDGLFIPAGSLPEAGAFGGRLVVESEQAREVLELGQVLVHANQEQAALAAKAEGGGDPPDAVPFLMEPQWKARLLLARAQGRTLTERLALPARAALPEGSSAVVSSSVAGRLSAPPGATLPRTGDAVEAGRVLGLVEPPLGAPELAQLQALALEFDLKALDVLRASGEARTRLRFAEREHERIGMLREEGLSTEQQLEQAEQGLALARSELEATGRMQESLDRIVAQRGAADEAEPGAPLRFPLQAPIAGTVAEVLGVPGGSVEAGQPIFRILDGSHIWVEGRVSEFQLPSIDGAPEAVAEFAALPGRRYELGGGLERGPYIGAEVDPSSRTLLVRYQLDNGDGAVRPGMLAELHVSTSVHVAPVVIPSEAVVMDQGLPSAYVMLSGELFQKRDLELGTKDGDWVEVLSGVEAGERVATRGAYLVKLAALAPDSFGAGHAH